MRRRIRKRRGVRVRETEGATTRYQRFLYSEMQESEVTNKLTTWNRTRARQETTDNRQQNKTRDNKTKKTGIRTFRTE